MIDQFPAEILLKVFLELPDNDLALCCSSKKLYRIFNSNKEFIRKKYFERRAKGVLANMGLLLKLDKEHPQAHVIYFSTPVVIWINLFFLKSKGTGAMDIQDQLQFYTFNLIFQYFDPLDLIKALVYKVTDSAKVVQELLALNLQFSYREAYTSADYTLHTVDLTCFQYQYLKCLNVKFPGLLESATIDHHPGKNFEGEEVVLSFSDDINDDEAYLVNEKMIHYYSKMVLGRIQSYRMDIFDIEFCATPTEMPESFPLPLFNCTSLVGRDYDFRLGKRNGSRH
ncbi:hypothetical protein HDV01_007921 [Terramyces sp. JEL0728]|nr:hypothetical protein HDV01_007921 [Terramyces sp. JEL0728]